MKNAVLLRQTGRRHASRFGVGIILALVLAAFAVAATAPVAATVAEPGHRISDLRREIARHDALYHQQAAPEISDFDFDQLKRRLAALEREFPDAARAAAPLREVGDDRSGLFPAHRHRERMLSLDKAYTEAEVRAFHARLAKMLGRDDLAYVVEPKFDGIAISLTYERGQLVRAATRGDGSEGDDVTSHAQLIANLPRSLAVADDDGVANLIPEFIELRGEIYVPFIEFARVNAEREAAGETTFANPRNLAAGTMRQRDGREVARRGLRIVIYGVGACLPASVAPVSQRELHARIEAWGLPGVGAMWSASGADELVRAIDAMGRARNGFDYPTDGAVAKLDAVALQREAGVGENAPRWALAFKFPPDRVETQLLAITWQVGRTGVLTPVAELLPVSLGGSTVARATLHNRDEIVRRDLRMGDSVYVEKAGEIIPALVGVNLARRPADAVPYSFPTSCPECGSSLVQREREAAVRCANFECAGQLRRRLEHFASKTCVDIEGLGPALIETLVERGLLKDLSDLYRLRPEALLATGKLGVKSGEQLLSAIERSKHAELWRVILGLGIPQVGAVGARELARQCESLAALSAMKNGTSAATWAAVQFFAEERNRRIVHELIAQGVNPLLPLPVSKTTLAGKTIVLTGTLPSFSRAEATARIEAAGGKVGARVTRSTHFVIAGANPGAKLEQARALKIAVGDEARLRQLLDDE